jgi:PAS domain S-box-containing protein
MTGLAMDFLSSVLGRMNGFLYRCRADEHYTMLDMTDGIQRIFGYKVDEIVGNRVRTFTSIMCEEDVPAMDAVVGKALESRTDWTLEYRIRHNSGHFIWVTETGGGVWDENGELLYLEGSIVNIESLYQRIDEQTADMRATASRTAEILALPETARRQRRHRSRPCRNGGRWLCRPRLGNAHAGQRFRSGRAADCNGAG